MRDANKPASYLVKRLGRVLDQVSSRFFKKIDALIGERQKLHGQRSSMPSGERQITVLEPAWDRLTDIVLAVLAAAKAGRVTVTTYEIVKTVWFADCAQLNSCGRPISFDVYKAMLSGPVGGALYDLLMEAPEAVAKTHGIKWKRTFRPDIANGTWEFHSPSAEPDTKEVLPISDVRALSDALKMVKKLNFFQLRAKTHEHPAYKAAFREDASRKSFPMDYALMLDAPDPELLATLVDLSAGMAAR